MNSMHKSWINFGNKKIRFYFFYPGLDCQNPQRKADGVCDDEINIVECEYDGGDCCGSNVNTKACKLCQCLDPNYNVEGSSGEYENSIVGFQFIFLLK